MLLLWFGSSWMLGSNRREHYQVSIHNRESQARRPAKPDTSRRQPTEPRKPYFCAETNHNTVKSSTTKQLAAFWINKKVLYFICGSIVRQLGWIFSLSLRLIVLPASASAVLQQRSGLGLACRPAEPIVKCCCYNSLVGSCFYQPPPSCVYVLGCSCSACMRLRSNVVRFRNLRSQNLRINAYWPAKKRTENIYFL